MTNGDQLNPPIDKLLLEDDWLQALLASEVEHGRDRRNGEVTPQAGAGRSVSRVPRFDVDVYGAVVYVCSTRDEVNACLESLGADTEDHKASNVGISIEVEGESSAAHILGVYDKSLDTLAHEASHICDMILRRKGIVGDVDTEVRAYLLGYVVGKAVKLLRGMKWPRPRRGGRDVR
jgi:hypothetical protein